MQLGYNDSWELNKPSTDAYSIENNMLENIINDVYKL